MKHTASRKELSCRCPADRSPQRPSRLTCITSPRQEFSRGYARESADNLFCDDLWYKLHFYMKLNAAEITRQKFRDSQLIKLRSFGFLKVKVWHP
jgi:hypothetical protein